MTTALTFFFLSTETEFVQRQRARPTRKRPREGREAARDLPAAGARPADISYRTREAERRVAALRHTARHFMTPARTSPRRTHGGAVPSRPEPWHRAARARPALAAAPGSAREYARPPPPPFRFASPPSPARARLSPPAGVLRGDRRFPARAAAAPRPFAVAVPWGRGGGLYSGSLLSLRSG